MREEIFNFKKINESNEKKNFELRKKIDILNETTQNLKQKIREGESLTKIENVVENNSFKSEIKNNFNREHSNNKKNTIKSVKSGKSQIDSNNLKIQRNDSSLKNKNEVIILNE